MIDRTESRAGAIVAELGDARRFGCSDDAVRHCGLDVTVHQSDNKRSPATSRTKARGCPLAAQQACRPASPDHEYYRQVARRIEQPRLPVGGTQALPTRLPHP
jgi:transposase